MQGRREAVQVLHVAKALKRLDEGKHRFQVRAIDAAGNVGPAAKDKFKVVG